MKKQFKEICKIRLSQLARARTAFAFTSIRAVWLLLKDVRLIKIDLKNSKYLRRSSSFDQSSFAIVETESFLKDVIVAIRAIRRAV